MVCTLRGATSPPTRAKLATAKATRRHGERTEQIFQSQVGTAIEGMTALGGGLIQYTLAERFEEEAIDTIAPVVFINCT